MQAALAAARATGRASMNGERVLAEAFPRGLVRASGLWSSIRLREEQHGGGLRAALPTASSTRSWRMRSPERGATGLSGDLHHRPARGRALPPRPAATAASPTSIRGHQWRRIGGAFGGEKDSGGGRGAGADAWRLAQDDRDDQLLSRRLFAPLAQGCVSGQRLTSGRAQQAARVAIPALNDSRPRVWKSTVVATCVAPGRGGTVSRRGSGAGVGRRKVAIGRAGRRRGFGAVIATYVPPAGGRHGFPTGARGGRGATCKSRSGGTGRRRGFGVP